MASEITLLPLGNVEVANMQITLNDGTLSYMLPLALNMRTTIRVGQTLGAGNIPEARIIARTSFLVSLMIGFVTSVAIIASAAPSRASTLRIPP